MGAGNFGELGTNNVRVTGVVDVGAILDVFQAHGHYQVDTARIYTGGTSEKVLGELDWKKRGLILDTKLWPNGTNGYPLPGAPLMSHKPDDLRKYLDESLRALKTDSINLRYLHAPDRTTPFEETLKAVNDLYKEGKFQHFGLSNYMSWEVAQVVEICKVNGYVVPTAYQGLYNAVHRTVEPELFPALREYGIAFYAFNPLGGGFFTGRYRSMHDRIEPGTRFDPNSTIGKISRLWYWNEPYFAALEKIEEVAKKHNLTLAEIALRWMSHHSLLKHEHGDAIIIGTSSAQQAEQNLVDLQKGPLPEEVVKALDEAWNLAKGSAANYFQ